MLMSELDFELPPSLIATHPAVPRDHSRLLVYRRSTGEVTHCRFFQIIQFFQPGDLLVVNDTRVLPAKVALTKETGARIGGLFLRELSPGNWEMLLKSRGRAREGQVLREGGFFFRLKERSADTKGAWIVEVSPPLPAREILATIGAVPLPPYIEKQRTVESPAIDEASVSAADKQDRRDYQTVYANTQGQSESIAAPTAGLHFTPELLAQLQSLGTTRVPVTLDVGLGTFLPVETDTLEAHPMHHETWSVPAASVSALRTQRQNGKRIVVVGTTAVRTLESAASQILTDVPVTDLRGSTDLKIMPGYTFQLTDVLITNFHLPRSTLMSLVGALVGVDKVKEIYAEAIRERYRFYSFGDAMLILP